MSLGIISLWRVRPLRLGLAIPLLRRQRLTTRFSSTTAKDEDGDDDRDEAEWLAQVRRSAQDRLRLQLGKLPLVKPAQVYPDKSLTRKSETQHHRHVTEQERHEYRRRYLLKKAVQWTDVLVLLSDSTEKLSSLWIDDGLKIKLSERAMARFQENMGDHKISSIRARTGATIKVSVQSMTLLLSGTKEAIHAAADEVRDIAGKMTVTRLSPDVDYDEGIVDSVLLDTPELEEFLTPPLSREEGGWVPRQWIYETVSKAVKRPQIWTVKSFEEYVCAIVDTKIVPHLQGRTYMMRGAGMDHERAVVNLLRDAFKAVSLETVASCSAFKIALRFMCQKGGKFLPEARAFVNMMIRRGIRLDTKVFNILLLAAVKTKDLAKFHETLQHLRLCKLQPNLETYLLFMRMFETLDVKLRILQHIYSKNLYALPFANRAVAAELAPLEAEYAVRQGMDIATFVAMQQGRYGPAWLTRDTGNTTLNVLCDHGLIDSAWRLLDVMHAGGIQPDTVSFNTILTYAQYTNKVALAVNVLRKMSAFHVHPDQLTLTLLFDIAWRARLRSTIVVLWRYACLARLTQWRMRRRLWLLLGTDSDNQKVYHAVGGDALARELLGGHAGALWRHRTTASQMWPKQDATAKSAVLAAKTIPLAFDECVPAVALSEVLVQSVLVDLRCLRAKKEGRLKEELATATVKNIPLLPRILPKEETWAEVVDKDTTLDPKTIQPDDKWEAQSWTSPGWADDSALKLEATEAGERQIIEYVPRRHAKIMAMINPRVWDDELAEHQDDPLQTAVQQQNQEAMVQALKALQEAHNNELQRTGSKAYQAVQNKEQDIST